jgi:hypothetical protein
VLVLHPIAKKRGTDSLIPVEKKNAGANPTTFEFTTLRPDGIVTGDLLRQMLCHSASSHPAPGQLPHAYICLQTQT